MLDGQTDEHPQHNTAHGNNKLYYMPNMGDKYNILQCDGEVIMAMASRYYDNEFNPLWQQTELIGSGHNLIVTDIDNDGKDEIFEGYNLLMMTEVLCGRTMQHHMRTKYS